MYPDLSTQSRALIPPTPILSGGQYAIANGGFIPLLLYCGRGVRSTAESFTAGFIAAGVTVIPGLLLPHQLTVCLPSGITRNTADVLGHYATYVAGISFGLRDGPLRDDHTNGRRHAARPGRSNLMLIG